MKHSRILNLAALLMLAVLVASARPANAGCGGCLNPITGDCYSNVEQAVTGFIVHTNVLGGGGFLSATTVNCLVAFALTAQAGNSASQFITLANLLLTLNTGQILPLGPGVFLTLVPLPQEGGPFLSTCFFNFRCPGGMGLLPLGEASVFQSGGTALSSDVCETERRLAAEALAEDLVCAANLALRGLCN